MLVENQEKTSKKSRVRRCITLGFFAFTISLIFGLTKQANAEALSKVATINEGHLAKITSLRADGFINAVAWNSDGSRIAALSHNGKVIKLWDTTTWQVINEFDRFPGGYSLNSFSFLPDGSVITSTPIGDNNGDPNFSYTKIMDPNYKALDIFSLIQWNPVTGKTVKYIPSAHFPIQQYTRENADTFAVSSDGNFIAGITALHEIYVFRMSDDVIQARIIIPEYAPRQDEAISVAFSPDGNELALGTQEGWILFYDPRTGILKHKFEAYPEYYDNPNVTPGIDPADPYKVKFNLCTAIAFSPDGKSIAVGRQAFGNEDPAPSPIGVRVFVAADGTKMKDLAVTSWPYGNSVTAVPVRSLAWSPDGRTLAAGEGRALRLWKTENNQFSPIFVNPTKASVYKVAFSSGGLLAATNNNEIEIYKIP